MIDFMWLVRFEFVNEIVTPPSVNSNLLALIGSPWANHRENLNIFCIIVLIMIIFYYNFSLILKILWRYHDRFNTDLPFDFTILIFMQFLKNFCNLNSFLKLKLIHETEFWLFS